jgi:hypothetical protein
MPQSLPLLDNPQSIRRLLTLTAEGVLNGTIDVPRARVLASICAIASRLLPKAEKSTQAAKPAPEAVAAQPASAAQQPLAASQQPQTASSAQQPQSASSAPPASSAGSAAQLSAAAQTGLPARQSRPCTNNNAWCPGFDHENACRDCRLRHKQLAANNNRRPGSRTAAAPAGPSL